MDNTIVYAMMISSALLMAMLPFGVFMGLGTIAGVGSSNWRLWGAYILIALVVSYILSLGAFALIQRSNCGSVKNMKQVSMNALISVGFQAGMLTLTSVIPWFRNIVMDLMPPDLDESIRDAVGYSYYSFWAMMFGIAVGGTLSGSCAKTID